MGFFIFFVTYIVELIMYFTSRESSFFTARLTVTIIYLVLLICSFYLSKMYGSGSLDVLKETSGDYGVGVKRAWTITNSQHVLVFYPTDKKQFTEAMKDEKNKLPWDVEGEMFHKELSRAI